MANPRSIMIYGPSGSTKTTQLYFLAKYILKITGKRIRMIHCSPGGYAPFEDSSLIKSGQVEVFDFNGSTQVLANIRRLSEGYWPRVTKDGGIYFRTEPVCMTTPEQWDGIGAYLIDDMTSMGEMLKNHCSNQTKGVGFSEAWKYEEDGYTLLGLTKGHYGIVQKEIYGRHVQGFRSLPIQYLIWTALVGKGEDGQSRETVYGPQLVGNASTHLIPSWFMDCYHLSKEKWVNAKGEEKEGMVAWFTPHSDNQTQVPYLCKTRIAPELFPKLLEKFPFGFVPLGFKHGLDILFMVMDKLRGEFQTEGK